MGTHAHVQGQSNGGCKSASTAVSDVTLSMSTFCSITSPGVFVHVCAHARAREYCMVAAASFLILAHELLVHVSLHVMQQGTAVDVGFVVAFQCTVATPVWGYVMLQTHNIYMLTHVHYSPQRWRTWVACCPPHLTPRGRCAGQSVPGPVGCHEASAPVER